jgi:N-acetyltransferase 10
MRKKVDSRVRTLVENGVKTNTRAFFVIVGDRGRDQVVNLHYMVTKIGLKKPSVLWCYKKELGFSSHRKKRAKQIKKQIKSGQHDPNADDPFELFISSTNIRYCYYKETEQVLGKTFGMCILQDFEALTPNILCRVIETVEGGGMIVLLLKTMDSLRQLYKLNMDAHTNLRTETHIDFEPRFNERFILSLRDCSACLLVDDELNILPLSAGSKGLKPIELQEGEDGELPKTAREIELDELKATTADSQPIGPILALSRTLDQAKVVMKFVDIISEKTLNKTVALTAGRGRGKSAALGLAIASAISYGYSNIFVTAPCPENLTTVFEFIMKGFDALGMVEHQQYELVQATNPELNKAVVRVNVFRDHRQTVQYVSRRTGSIWRRPSSLSLTRLPPYPCQ